MNLPIIRIPISRKVIATFIVAGVLAALRTVGVVETSPELTAWITVGGGLAAGVLASEGKKYIGYAIDKLELPIELDVEE